MTDTVEIHNLSELRQVIDDSISKLDPIRAAHVREVAELHPGETFFVSHKDDGTNTNLVFFASDGEIIPLAAVRVIDWIVPGHETDNQ